MVRFFTSLIVTVVIVAVVVIAWAPTAKSGGGIPEDSCDDFCQTQTACMCAKLLGGSLRLTQCVIAPDCNNNNFASFMDSGGSFCDCSSATPVCKLWEFPLVAQQLPFESQECGPIVCPTSPP